MVEKFVEVERLGEVMVGLSALEVGGLVGSGDEKYRDRAIRGLSLDEVVEAKAVHIGEPEIEDDEIDLDGVE